MSYSYQAYEAAKAQWLRMHPDATPAQIEAAMTRIARQMGL
jgi:hypothetical protein